MAASSAGRLVIPHDFPKADDYEVPYAPSPFYDITILEDPPDTAKVILNRTWRTIFNDRALSREVLRTLVKHHCWGFVYSQGGKEETKEVLVKALFKVFYHMKPEYRPRTFSELFDLKRDAGPRLLGWDKKYAYDPSLPRDWRTGHRSEAQRRKITQSRYEENERRPLNLPMPVSIQHPNLPPLLHPNRRYNPPYVPPRPVPLMGPTQNEIPASHIRQFLFPLYRNQLPDDPWAPLTDPSGNPFVVVGENPPHAADPSQPSTHPALADGNPPSAHFPPLPKMKHSTQPQVRDAMVKALLKLTYHELERDPKAPARGPAPTRIAKREDAWDTVQVGLYPAYSRVMVNPTSLQLDPILGHECLYRGRGPVGSPDSAAVDTVIVIGMLTEVGCTQIDRDENRADLYDDVENSFIEATNMNWDVLSREMSKELRDSFFRQLHLAYPALGMGQALPPWAVWAKLTRNFAQFQYLFQDRQHYCDCEHRPYNDSLDMIGTCVLPPWKDSDRNGVTPSELIARKFGMESKFDCPICQGSVGTGRVVERTMLRLPPRLVLTMHENTALREHTKEVSFEFRDENNKLQTAKYRWLGGVYYREERLRVFWSETQRDGADPATLSVYDPLLLSGVIIGSVPAASPERVPPEWIQETPPFLIYERVLDPPQPLLDLVGKQVTHMMRNLTQGKPALEGHKANWEDPRPRRGFTNPRLPVFGERHFNIQRPDPSLHLMLDPLRGNVTQNLFSLMTVNPHHPLIPNLFQAVAGQPLPQNVPPAAPEYPLPQAENVFPSMLTGPGQFFDNPQKWALGPPEVEQEMATWGPTELPDVPTAAQQAALEQAERDLAQTQREQEERMQEMWTDWVNFSPSHSPEARGGKVQVAIARRRDSDIHMTGMSADPNFYWSRPRLHPTGVAKKETAPKDRSTPASRVWRTETVTRPGRLEPTMQPAPSTLPTDYMESTHFRPTQPGSSTLSQNPPQSAVSVQKSVSRDSDDEVEDQRNKPLRPLRRPGPLR
ncbi:hypothetical protein N7532_012057 [Penicillium argentinense]|uniref:Uncharacterized protein n=1 Tax=Penicillium argentinense TaxID=1131581 RepID=A0A9W9EJM4_9EURO|nr:uncharacterized protein N7532_012057 [Penicillium argentinense]KAJ5083014.1 hypothetical protein N7532_012057 [Penicillium argentinense]